MKSQYKVGSMKRRKKIWTRQLYTHFSLTDPLYMARRYKDFFNGLALEGRHPLSLLLALRSLHKNSFKCAGKEKKTKNNDPATFVCVFNEGTEPWERG